MRDPETPRRAENAKARPVTRTRIRGPKGPLTRSSIRADDGIRTRDPNLAKVPETFLATSGNSRKAPLTWENAPGRHRPDPGLFGSPATEMRPTKWPSANYRSACRDLLRSGPRIFNEGRGAADPALKGEGRAAERSVIPDSPRARPGADDRPHSKGLHPLTPLLRNSQEHRRARAAVV